MRFTGSFLVTASFAGSVLGAPSSRLMERISTRSQSRQSHPLEPIFGGHDGSKDGYRTADTGANVAYSSNWAGAVREAPPPGASYTAVTATFTVPAAKATGTEGTQAGSAWVGIDGDTYGAAILQTGVDFYIEGGKPVNSAWFEWFPDYAYDFSIQVSTGDVIVAKVESWSPSQGVAIIENESNGQSVTQTVSAPAATATLAGQNAEWIVEDFQSGNTLVSLVDFDSIVFTGAQAQAGGSTYGLDGATIIELKQNNQVKTNVVISNNNELVVSYV